MRRTDFTKANTYTGQKIKNATVSLKIDGVRILYRDNIFVTRNDKVPAGLLKACTEEALDKIKYYKDCEIYMGNFLTTNGVLAQHNPQEDCITEDMIYPLVDLDERLHLYHVDEISYEAIMEDLDKYVKEGYEGLVIRTDKGSWYRVKPTSTATVEITRFFEQLNKSKQPKNMLGGFNTPYGKVTAFKEEDRIALWDNPEQYIGKFIEVQYKERYHTGKFRYAVKFIDFRHDSNDTSFDTEPPHKGG